MAVGQQSWQSVANPQQVRRLRLVRVAGNAGDGLPSKQNLKNRDTLKLLKRPEEV
ncbi:MAG: hypothetical protein WC023_07020 [Rhodocyclaceae bacterium]